MLHLSREEAVRRSNRQSSRLRPPCRTNVGRFVATARACPAVLPQRPQRLVAAPPLCSAPATQSSIPRPAGISGSCSICEGSATPVSEPEAALQNSLLVPTSKECDTLAKPRLEEPKLFCLEKPSADRRSEARTWPSGRLEAVSSMGCSQVAAMPGEALDTQHRSRYKLQSGTVIAAVQICGLADRGFLT